MYAILFFSFAQELQEWLSCLDEFNTCIKDNAVTEWTPELIQKLEQLDNKITHAVDHWIDHLLGGFVTKFSIDQFVSYSKAKRRFFKGPRGKFLHSLKFLLKMLLREPSCLCKHTA